MDRRTKVIIFIVIAIIVLGAIVGLLWWLIGPRGGVVNVNESSFEPRRIPTSGLNNSNTSAEIKEPQLEANLKAVANTFTERFGSYSNQGNFQNLEDLRDLMTVKMKGWTDNFIQQQKVAMGDDSIYYGITTKAISATIATFEASLGRAEVVVETQRQEAKGSTINPKVFYQKMQLKLVQTGEGWKVDEVNWL